LVAYPRDEIDRVRERTDLVELASEITKVKRSGRSVMAVCPFHQEKTPSLSIDGARGLYHCFGCGKSGDVFRWVQETQSVDFRDAVELLARRAGVILTEDPAAGRQRGQREELIKVTTAAVEYFSNRLKKADDAAAARRYLRNRGYDADVVDRFEIGFSPAGWDALTRFLKDQGFTEKALMTSGVSSRSRTGRLIDRFRGRVMFPIRDLRGDPVGFGARLLEGDGPKYLNSPETPIYHKSRLLYGLDRAKGGIVAGAEAVVVEGYTDVIAFHLADMPVAVATCGTALGEEHLDLLRRFTERVVLAFDADEAGAGAALRGFEHSVPGDLDLRVAALPAGRDPADLVQDGDIAGLVKSVEASIPLLQFRLETELARFDLTEAEARGRAIGAAAALVALHPDDVVRHEYGVLLSRRTGVDLPVIDAAIRRARRAVAGGRGRPGDAVEVRKLTGNEKGEQEILRILLANEEGWRDAGITENLFTRDDHIAAFGIIWPVLQKTARGAVLDLGSLIGDDDTPAGQLLRRLAFDERPLAQIEDLVNRLKVSGLERRIDSLRVALEEIDPDAEAETYSARFNELIALERQRRELRGEE
jgi:DNA primase